MTEEMAIDFWKNFGMKVHAFNDGSLLTCTGNAVDALAVQTVGNKRPVEKSELIEFIYTITK
jgi:hypothetical protein